MAVPRYLKGCSGDKRVPVGSSLWICAMPCHQNLQGHTKPRHIAQHFDNLIPMGSSPSYPSDMTRCVASYSLTIRSNGLLFLGPSFPTRICCSTKLLAPWTCNQKELCRMYLTKLHRCVSVLCLHLLTAPHAGCTPIAIAYHDQRCQSHLRYGQRLSARARLIQAQKLRESSDVSVGEEAGSASNTGHSLVSEILEQTHQAAGADKKNKAHDMFHLFKRIEKLNREGWSSNFGAVSSLSACCYVTSVTLAH